MLESELESELELELGACGFCLSSSAFASSLLSLLSLLLGRSSSLLSLLELELELESLALPPSSCVLRLL